MWKRRSKAAKPAAAAEHTAGGQATATMTKKRERKALKALKAFQKMAKLMAKAARKSPQPAPPPPPSPVSHLERPHTRVSSDPIPVPPSARSHARDRAAIEPRLTPLSFDDDGATAIVDAGHRRPRQADAVVDDVDDSQHHPPAHAPASRGAESGASRLALGEPSPVWYHEHSSRPIAEAALADAPHGMFLVRATDSIAATRSSTRAMHVCSLSVRVPEDPRWNGAGVKHYRIEQHLGSKQFALATNSPGRPRFAHITALIRHYGTEPPSLTDGVLLTFPCPSTATDVSGYSLLRESPPNREALATARRETAAALVRRSNGSGSGSGSGSGLLMPLLARRSTNGSFHASSAAVEEAKTAATRSDVDGCVRRSTTNSQTSSAGGLIELSSSQPSSLPRSAGYSSSATSSSGSGGCRYGDLEDDASSAAAFHINPELARRRPQRGPRPISSESQAGDVVAWLKELGVAKTAASHFEHVDGDLLLQLGFDDFTEAGIAPEVATSMYMRLQTDPADLIPTAATIIEPAPKAAGMLVGRSFLLTASG